MNNVSCSFTTVRRAPPMCAGLRRGAAIIVFILFSVGTVERAVFSCLFSSGVLVLPPKSTARPLFLFGHRRFGLGPIANSLTVLQSTGQSGYCFEIFFESGCD